MADRVRIDQLLVTRGLSESRSAAQRLVMAGQVRIKGEVAVKPSQLVTADSQIEVISPPPYVSRGGEKLAAALAAFPIPVEGAICADVGASTGGFTDCLLQAGAAKVYAIDAGRGQLHWRLRQDPRVVAMEGTNARYVSALPVEIQIATVDASFISLRLLLPRIFEWLVSDGHVIALVKPQFEAGRAQVGKGGVVKDPEVHRQVLTRVAEAVEAIGFSLRGLISSPLLGPKGNREFLLWGGRAGEPQPTIELIQAALATAAGEEE